MPANAVYEFRNYITHPGKRDLLIEMFEREFIESQEALGSRVVGTFRNVDNPDRFVWIRSFQNMETRAQALDGFYTSALWQGLRSEANATMIDSDDVLQLRPISGDATRGQTRRASKGAVESPQAIVVATTYFLPPQSGDTFAQLYRKEALPILRDVGHEPFATFATEHAANSYPRLPVRENETVFVTLTYFASPEEHRAHIADDKAAINDVAGALRVHLLAPTETLRLQPTARSLLC